MQKKTMQASLGKGTVVDVGGGHGPVSIDLDQRFPRLSFIVQDLPDVVASRPSIPDPDMASRNRFAVYDFLTEQPVKGADVYFFRAIFHNWPRSYCVQILRNQIPTLRDGARLVINEGLLPKPKSLPHHLERRRRYDLISPRSPLFPRNFLANWTGKDSAERLIPGIESSL